MRETKKLENVLLLATSHNITKAYISKLNNYGLIPNKAIYLNINRKKKALIEKIKHSLNKYSLAEISTIVARKLKSNPKKKKTKLKPENIEPLLQKIENELTSRNYFTTDLRKSTKSVLKEVDWQFDEINISSINDEVLVDYLKNNVKEKFIIFCGGGILRDPILSTGKRFIHIHPGVVPEVKGADCLLWSSMVYNEVGMSSFFMNKGIDTGDIIKTNRYDVPKFDLNMKTSTPNSLKKILINFVDPHYRADHLLNTFKEDLNPDNWETDRQNPAEGKQYYFMHDALLPDAISKFIKL